MFIFDLSSLRQLDYYITFQQCCQAKSFLFFDAFASNGEGGIRTHAPLRTNGFQDRLVMTTSIPLHERLYKSTSSKSLCQDVFLFFLNVRNFLYAVFSAQDKVYHYKTVMSTQISAYFPQIFPHILST